MPLIITCCCAIRGNGTGGIQGGCGIHRVVEIKEFIRSQLDRSQLRSWEHAIRKWWLVYVGIRGAVDRYSASARAGVQYRYEGASPSELYSDFSHFLPVSASSPIKAGRSIPLAHCAAHCTHTQFEGTRKVDFRTELMVHPEGAKACEGFDSPFAHSTRCAESLCELSLSAALVLNVKPGWRTSGSPEISSISLIELLVRVAGSDRIR